MQYLPVQEKVHQRSASFGKFRMAIERVRDAFENMQFSGNLGGAKLLEQTLAVFERDRDVLCAVKNRGRRETRRDVSCG